MITPTATAPDVVATGCFTKDVLVKTNQGLIKIVDMTKENTIDGKKIIGISKIIYSQPNIVTIKKDALGENNPSADINVAPYTN
jgi:signal recognition particle receptor subunit beta